MVEVRLLTEAEFKIVKDVCERAITEDGIREVSGVLLGAFEGEGVVYVCDAIPTSEGSGAEVEIKPEALLSAEEEARKGLRIVGWYHSHPPDFGIEPSSRDKRTQISWQEGIDERCVMMILTPRGEYAFYRLRDGDLVRLEVEYVG